MERDLAEQGKALNAVLSEKREELRHSKWNERQLWLELRAWKAAAMALLWGGASAVGDTPNTYDPNGGRTAKWLKVTFPEDGLELALGQRYRVFEITLRVLPVEGGERVPVDVSKLRVRAKADTVTFEARGPQEMREIQVGEEHEAILRRLHGTHYPVEPDTDAAVLVCVHAWDEDQMGAYMELLGEAVKARRAARAGV